MIVDSKTVCLGRLIKSLIVPIRLSILCKAYYQVYSLLSRILRFLRKLNFKW